MAEQIESVEVTLIELNKRRLFEPPTSVPTVRELGDAIAYFYYRGVTYGEIASRKGVASLTIIAPGRIIVTMPNDMTDDNYERLKQFLASARPANCRVTVFVGYGEYAGQNDS